MFSTGRRPMHYLHSALYSTTRTSTILVHLYSFSACESDVFRVPVLRFKGSWRPRSAVLSAYKPLTYLSNYCRSYKLHTNSVMIA